MSDVTLTFAEYQTIRDTLGMAEGTIENLGGDPTFPALQPYYAAYGYTVGLPHARAVLNDARWRTEDLTPAQPSGTVPPMNDDREVITIFVEVEKEPTNETEDWIPPTAQDVADHINHYATPRETDDGWRIVGVTY